MHIYSNNPVPINSAVNQTVKLNLLVSNRLNRSLWLTLHRCLYVCIYTNHALPIKRIN